MGCPHSWSYEQHCQPSIGLRPGNRGNWKPRRARATDKGRISLGYGVKIAPKTIPVPGKAVDVETDRYKNG